MSKNQKEKISNLHIYYNTRVEVIYYATITSKLDN